VDDFGEDPGRLSGVQIGCSAPPRVAFPVRPFAPRSVDHAERCACRTRAGVCSAGFRCECCAGNAAAGIGQQEMVTINCDMARLRPLQDGRRRRPDASFDVAKRRFGFTAPISITCAGTGAPAKQHGVKVGAHPSLPDLQGFGRREMKIGRDELSELPALPDRRAQGVPGCRRRGHQSHQAARLALRHGPRGWRTSPSRGRRG